MAYHLFAQLPKVLNISADDHKLYEVIRAKSVTDISQYGMRGGTS